MSKIIIWSLFVVLFFMHQDFWWWNDSELVFGFMPMGLAYHAGFSIACSILGWLAIRFAWPHDLEAFAEEK
ncbi:DUF3311 domain-containing protein [Opitutales bacterium]|nr:DUF3311 domain-containing protein [Opitutales bacterium]MDA8990880.1 DUF3311 domain-containing protein [Opitutales bacterium]